MHNRATIIIPTLNEERFIARCLDSIIANDYPKNLIQVLVIDGMSDDRTREIVLDYIELHPYIQLLNNPKHTVPFAMNIGIRRSLDEFVIRLDAHAKYPQDYISKLIFWHENLAADNLGGICITEVCNKSSKSTAIKLVLSDKYGVGNALFRIGVSQITEVDTVPFGCYRRDTFDKYGLYDERLSRNQDIELNKRIKKNGGKIYLIPDITCSYYARETYGSLAKNNFSNGLWNILTSYYTKTLNSLSVRHFIPLLFILSLLIPSFIACFYFPAVYISIISALLYMTMLVSRIFKLNNNSTNMLYLGITFMVLHISYGVGSMFGLIRLFPESFKRTNKPHPE